MIKFKILKKKEYDKNNKFKTNKIDRKKRHLNKIKCKNNNKKCINVYKN